MIHEYSREELLIGAEGIKKLKKATVMVFGVGGVGSHCIEALARGGIGHLILVDNDTVSLTNINRQSIAYHSTIGRYKTEVMKERIRDIDPAIKAASYETFVLPDNVEELFERAAGEYGGEEDSLSQERPWYIIDAVDTVSAKISIVEQAYKRKIPVISCMGTGNKLHPELFEIEDLARTSVCPLCRVMRKELKARGIPHLTVLYSKERPVDVSGRETEEEKGQRRSLPGSISFVPPVAGLLIAGAVIRKIAGV